MKPVNPTLLINDPVKINFDEASYVDSPPANVGQKSGGVYTVTINKQATKKLSEVSGIAENQLILGLLYHEVAHIKYGSFESSNASDTLRHWVDNLIEDTRIEYHMSYDYPYVAKYIALILLAFKDKIVVDPLEEGSEIEKLTSQLLRMVRLNIIPDDCEEEFVEFMLPRMLLARRSNRAKAAKIVTEIYDYLKLLSDSEQTCLEDYNPYSKCEKEGGKEGENDQKQAGNAEGTGEDGEGSNQAEGGANDDDIRQDKIEKLLEQLGGGEGGIEGGKGADEVIDDLIGSNEFIRTAINNNNEIVRKVHKAFAEIFTKNHNVATKEGDINLKRMQDAYMNRLTGEDGYDYHIQKRCETAFDCVILRDTSGSVADVAKEYANIVCVLAKALEELHGVKVGVIDFNSVVKVRKAFNQPLIKADIKPVGMGGTNLLDALLKLNDIPFKQKTKICILITDGWPNSPAAVVAEAKKEKYKDFIWLPILFGDDISGQHIEYMEEAFGKMEAIRKIDDLHKAVYKLIKEKVLTQ